MLQHPLSVNDLFSKIELEFEELARTSFIRNSVQTMKKLRIIYIEKCGCHVGRY